MTYYPPLTDPAAHVLELWAANLKENGRYIAESTYPMWIKDMFGKVEGEGETEEGPLVVSDELVGLLRDIREAKGNFKADDHAERMSYFRTTTSLLERIVQLQERATNLDKIRQFYGIVLAVIERHVPAGSVGDVQRELKEAMGDGQ